MILLHRIIILGVLLPNYILSDSSYQDGTKKSEVRKLSVVVNPGCTVPDFCNNTGNGSLVHVRSDSATNSLHFIWNFFGSPSLLLARTDLTTNLIINWEDLFLGKVSALSFDPSEKVYSFGTSLITVWTFDDKFDKVRMDQVNQSTVVSHNTKDFIWKTWNEGFVNRSDLIQFSHISREYNGTSLGPHGYINITVKIRNTDGYSDILPYMYHNGNSSQVDISFNEITQLNGPLNPTARIGLGYVFVQQFPHLYSNSSKDYGMTIHRIKELDDEHTPGVFEMFSMRTRTVNSYDQSYLEWKPIAYTAQVRDIADSIDVHVYRMEDKSADGQELDGTLLWSFYGNNISTLIVQTANITFGSSGDGFYNKTSHISWTYMTGYGIPPTDSVSLLVILTLATGLGIPFIIIIIAIIYLFTKRLSKSQDALLLGR